ncbi:hypothetical protein NFI96_025916, partial [Prochilodus magdalenae]
GHVMLTLKPPLEKAQTDLNVPFYGPCYCNLSKSYVFSNHRVGCLRMLGKRPRIMSRTASVFPASCCGMDPHQDCTGTGTGTGTSTDTT